MDPQIWDNLYKWLGPGAAVGAAVGWSWWQDRNKRRLEDANVNSSYAAAGAWQPLFQQHKEMLDSLAVAQKSANDRVAELSDELRNAQDLVVNMKAQVQAQEAQVQAQAAQIKSQQEIIEQQKQMISSLQTLVGGKQNDLP